MENKKKGKRLNSMNKEVQLLLNLLKSFVLDVNETNDGSNISREEWLNVMRLANHQNILPLVLKRLLFINLF